MTADILSFPSIASYNALKSVCRLLKKTLDAKRESNESMTQMRVLQYC